MYPRFFTLTTAVAGVAAVSYVAHRADALREEELCKQEKLYRDQGFETYRRLEGNKALGSGLWTVVEKVKPRVSESPSDLSRGPTSC